MHRLLLIAALVCGALSLHAAALNFTRSESGAAKPGDRKRRLERTLVFAQREPYDPSQNVLHRYTDRPLFSDPRLRNRQGDGADGFAPFLRDVRILRSCGFDGFGSLDYIPIHLDQLRVLDSLRDPISGYSQMIVVPGYAPDARYQEIKDMILTSAKSPVTTRIDGKIVLWCYGGGADAHLRWARKLRSDPDLPPFLFVGDLPFMTLYQSWDGSGVPAAKLDEVRAKIRESVQAMDGLQLWLTNCEMDPFGEYGWSTLRDDRYEKGVLPELRQALSMPDCQGRLVGAYIKNGYVNPFTGVLYKEDGTARLRGFLDEAILANPDILMLFEWNEANENTHFQPTVAHGRTWTRILSYYRSLLDRTPPVPQDGDDQSIPNLIVSARRALKLGEPYHVELLYLPDGADVREFTVRASLVGANGAVIGSFPLERLKTDKLTAVSYRLPSESLASQEGVTLELETDYRGTRKKWNGFVTTELAATTCRDYLYVHAPLRELFEPKNSSLEVRQVSGGAYEIDAAFETASEDKIASLEIVDGIEEVAAASPSANDATPTEVLFRGSMTSAGDLSRTGRIRVRGTSGARLASANGAWEHFQLLSAEDGGWNVSSRFVYLPAKFLLAVPKADVAGARVEVEFGDLGRFEQDLHEVLRCGIKAFPLTHTARVEIERVDDLADLPEPMKAGAAKVHAVVRRPSPRPMFTLRAISRSGKIWRSRPHVFPQREKSREKIVVFSETKRTPVSVELAKGRVPDIVYAFTNFCGAILPCLSDRRWDASIGGGTSYAEPMLDALVQKKLPDGVDRCDAEWIRDGGQWALRFDGKGSYLVLPQEAIPCGAVFTVAFEIKPEEGGNLVLLRQRMYGGGGLNVTTVDGRLRIAYLGKMEVEGCLDTHLEIPVGEWSKVTLSRDFSKITCSVNGKEESFPHDRRGMYFNGATFGNDIEPARFLPEGAKPFKGLLRSLEIKHGKLNQRQ